MNSRERFARKVKVRESGCHEWTGCRLPAGYGKLLRDGRTWLAHRYAWFLEHGEEPDALILHRCDNPPCVNPAHLFVGTAKDNTGDMHAKGRHNVLPYQTTRRAKNTSGRIGVRRSSKSASWQAMFSRRYLGTFPTFEEAVAARVAAELESGGLKR